MDIYGIAVGTLFGVIVRKLWNRPLIKNLGNSERYGVLLRGQLSNDHVDAEERSEFERMTRANWKFENSRIGDIQTATLLACLERMMKRELDESRANIAIFMDQWMQELKKECIIKF